MRILRNGVALLLAAALALAVAACGKQPDDTLKARFTALSETDLIEQILADPAGHQDEIASFGLDDFMTKFGEADAYRSYMVQIDVQNQNNFDVEVLNLQMDVAKQGTGDVYFAALAESMPIGLPAKYSGGEALYYTVIASTLLSKEQILQTLGEMGITCVYMKGSEAPDMDAEIDPSQLSTSVILYEG
ncbi:MAG: hypothetical protein IKW76_04660 [Clostridia bacterium]|nr:hypothetical protein [Clostridia bacterium]